MYKLVLARLLDRWGVGAKNENPGKLLSYRSRIEHLYKYHIIDKYHLVEPNTKPVGWLSRQ